MPRPILTILDDVERLADLQGRIEHEARHGHPAYLPPLTEPAPLNPEESARLDALLADLTREESA